jgi:hypothetical protein
MRRLLCGALGLLAAILSYPAFAETLPPADKPSPKAGVIEYDSQVMTQGCKRWEVTATDKDGSIISQCGDNIAYISATNGNLTKVGAVVKFVHAESPDLNYQVTSITEK